jgi:high affinity Mn2+ porin
MRRAKVGLAATIAMALHGGSVEAQPAGPSNTAFAWSGFYAGAHLGYAWGTNDWTVANNSSGLPLASGSFSTFQPFNPFTEAGSFNAGLQAGYNYSLGHRVFAGIEVDVSYPAWPSLAGTTIGGQSTFVTPTQGLQTFSENVVHAGSLRARLGYAPASWFLYATGGLAWTRDTLMVTSVASGTSEEATRTRYGWVAVGAHVAA